MMGNMPQQQPQPTAATAASGLASYSAPQYTSAVPMSRAVGH